METQYGLFHRVCGSTTVHLHLAMAQPVVEDDRLVARFQIRLIVAGHVHTAMAAGIGPLGVSWESTVAFAAQAAYKEIWFDLEGCGDMPSVIRDFMRDFGRPTVVNSTFITAAHRSLDAMLSSQ